MKAQDTDMCNLSPFYKHSSVRSFFFFPSGKQSCCVYIGPDSLNAGIHGSETSHIRKLFPKVEILISISSFWRHGLSVSWELAM